MICYKIIGHIMYLLASKFNAEQKKNNAFASIMLSFSTNSITTLFKVFSFYNRSTSTTYSILSCFSQWYILVLFLQAKNNKDKKLIFFKYTVTSCHDMKCCKHSSCSQESKTYSSVPPTVGCVMTLLCDLQDHNIRHLHNLGSQDNCRADLVNVSKLYSSPYCSCSYTLLWY